MTLKGQIFISYRRDGGFEMARLIRDALQKRGYKVFLDVEELRSGPFNTAIVGQIESSSDVIAILTPGSLERCFQEDDWMRLEVAHAIKLKKNIVPVITRGFKWPAERLPEDLMSLPSFNGIEPSHDFFDASMDKLRKLLVGHPKRVSRMPLVIVLTVSIMIIVAGLLLSGLWRGRKSSVDSLQINTIKHFEQSQDSGASQKPLLPSEKKEEQKNAPEDKPITPPGAQMSPYFSPLMGKLIYKNGSEQSFSGFRCFYSNRLYYSRSLEDLRSNTYRSASSIAPKALLRIDFSERPNENVRRGTARLSNGKSLDDVFFYVEECSWWEEPGLKGQLNAPGITTLIIIEPPKDLKKSIFKGETNRAPSLSLDDQKIDDGRSVKVTFQDGQTKKFDEVFYMSRAQSQNFDLYHESSNTGQGYINLTEQEYIPVANIRVIELTKLPLSVMNVTIILKNDEKMKGYQYGARSLYVHDKTLPQPFRHDLKNIKKIEFY
jgi:hypothetical protein